MSIEWFRDFVIAIVGVVAAGVLIYAAVILGLLYRRTSSLLDSMNIISKNIETVCSSAGELARPVVEMVALLKGVRTGIKMAEKFFHRGE